MRRTLIAILLVAFFTTSLPAKELTGTLEQIKKTGIINIGYRQAQPPMSFLNEDGIPAGYSIDICKKVVTEIRSTIGGNVKIEYVPVSAENRFSALTDNKIDILCGATTKTLSRGEIVDFTQLTFITGASFMTLKGKNIKNNFDGKKIGVTKGTTTAIELNKLLKETQVDAEVVLMSSTTEGLKALNEGKIDTFSADQVVLIGLALSTENPKNYIVLPNLFSYEPFALAVRRNDADFRLVADRVISDLYRTRNILKIYDEWIGKFSNQRTSGFEALIKLNAIPE